MPSGRLNESCWSESPAGREPEIAENLDTITKLPNYPITNFLQTLLKFSSGSSSAPWRRRMLGRFCENAERGMTTSHPASCALILRSPWTWETKPRIEVGFLNFERSLEMIGSG